MDGSLTGMLNQRKTLLEAHTGLNEAGYLELEVNSGFAPLKMFGQMTQGGMQVKGTEVFIGQQGGLQKLSIQVPVRPDNPCEGAEQAGGELGTGTCGDTLRHHSLLRSFNLELSSSSLCRAAFCPFRAHSTAPYPAPHSHTVLLEALKGPC